MQVNKLNDETLPKIEPVELEPDAINISSTVTGTLTVPQSSYEDRMSRDLDSETYEILAISAMSPSAGLIQLSASLERICRRILAATGHLSTFKRPPSLRRMADELERVTELPKGSFDVLRSFSSIRNQIVHGEHGVSDHEVLRAIDSGISLLRSLKTVPLERHQVYRRNVSIFADRQLSTTLDCKGLFLKFTSRTNNEISFHIYPTTKLWFREGMDVSWDWNPNQVWPEGWYQDLVSKEPTIAWSSSMEFIGVDLDKV